jgi:hypothetical protein
MKENLIGQKFGRLTVIARAENNKQGQRMWLCQCDCGKTKDKPVPTYSLKSGKVKSCGCLYFQSNKGRNVTHGKAGTRIYQIWSSMKGRCTNTKNLAFNDYGGRGIEVCEEWRSDFTSFYDWAVSHGYRDDLTLDRIDNNGNYEPSNCRWATYKEQENNRRNNRIIMYENREYTVSQLAKKLNISPAALRWRLENGWNESELSLTPALNNRVIRSARL